MAPRRDLALCYAAIAGVSLLTLIVPLPVSLQMSILTATTIYIACHSAISADKDVKPEQSEVMGRSDVYMFPIIGSCVLFSLYLTFKLFPTFLVTFFVKLYFTAIGTYVVYARAAQLIKLFVPEPYAAKLAAFQTKVPLTPLNNAVDAAVAKAKALYAPHEATVAPHLAKAKDLYAKASKVAADVWEKAQPLLAQAEQKLNSILGEEKAKPAVPAPAAAPAAAAAAAAPAGNGKFLPDALDLTGAEAAAAVFSVVTAVVYLLFNFWLANNVYGIAFSLQAIELLNLGSVLNGAILLSALFVYDVFWVFGTDVMVTVAKSIDGPIKLLFPVLGNERKSMLGLGDIVIPGIFLAMVLRVDRKLARPVQTPAKPAQPFAAAPAAWAQYALAVIANFNLGNLPFRAEYFNVAMVGYVAGLLVTLIVMFGFKAAQPALLYLVPACLGSVFGLAYSKGKAEFDAVFNYVDEEEAQAALAVDAAAAGFKIKTVPAVAAAAPAPVAAAAAPAPAPAVVEEVKAEPTPVAAEPEPEAPAVEEAAAPAAAEPEAEAEAEAEPVAAADE